jgi:hypothetical protein
MYRQLVHPDALVRATLEQQLLANCAIWRVATIQPHVTAEDIQHPRRDKSNSISPHFSIW